jgi:hypothetical protein
MSATGQPFGGFRVTEQGSFISGSYASCCLLAREPLGGGVC